MELSYDLIARRIDHSLLGPTMTTDELEAGCRLALVYDVASVCIKPYAVSLARSILGGSRTAVGTTIGFPHGGHTSAIKVAESRQAIADGATELDMVINIGQARSGDWDAVSADIGAITRLAHESGALVKVIFENCYLDDDQKARLCAICGDHAVDYVKTSTGYGTGCFTSHDLELMRRLSTPTVKLKAAGGIRDLDGAIAAVKLGCDRIGASKTAEILDALRARLEGRAEVSTAVPRGTDNY